MTDASTAACYYCGARPVHRTGPAGWAICAACDDKIDRAFNRKVLIDIQGGVMQGLFVTGGVNARFFLIDWDAIKEGDFNEAPWGTCSPQELTPEEFRERLNEAEEKFGVLQAAAHRPALEQPPPVEEPPKKTRYIWVAVIHHKHGNDIIVSATKRGCLVKIYGYVKGSWADVFDEKPIPEDPQAAVDEYFTYVSDHGIHEYIDYWERTEVTP